MSTARDRGRHRDRECGSATVEFTLVSVLATAIFLAVVQVGIAIHVRNTLVAAAGQGARYGAVSGRSPADASARTREVITDALSETYARTIDAGYATVDGIPTVVVRVTAPLPVFGLVGLTGDLTIEGHALAETPP